MQLQQCAYYIVLHFAFYILLVDFTHYIMPIVIMICAIVIYSTYISIP